MTRIHTTPETSIPTFDKDRYVAVESGLSKETIDLVTQYALFDELQDYTIEMFNQVKNAHSKYADPMMESLLVHLQPVIEKYTGLKLYPTYSYYRVYRPGDALDHHTDRPACEVSLTLSFEYDYKGKTNYQWPIYIAGEPVFLTPGQMAIYRGCELDHWREPFDAPDESFHVQAFLHYVDQSGPNVEEKFDRRESVGMSKKFTGHQKMSGTRGEAPKSSQPTINAQGTKSYIEYTK